MFFNFYFYALQWFQLFSPLPPSTQPALKRSFIKQTLPILGTLLHRLEKNKGKQSVPQFDVDMSPFFLVPRRLLLLSLVEKYM